MSVLYVEIAPFSLHVSDICHRAQSPPCTALPGVELAVRILPNKLIQFNMKKPHRAPIPMMKTVPGSYVHETVLFFP